MRHEGPFFLFKSEKMTDEGQLKQMRQVPENLFFFFFLALGQNSKVSLTPNLEFFQLFESDSNFSKSANRNEW